MKQKTTLTPRNFMDVSRPTGNIYESVVVIAKRAKQIALKTKDELNSKLSDLVFHTDSLEEVFDNTEHIEISKSYEKKPKPTTIATEEFLAGKIMYRHPDEETSPSA